MKFNMGIIDGYISECPKCKNRSYYDLCNNCGTDCKKYNEKQMVDNLKKFGFEEVIKYYPQNFIQKKFQKPKIKDSYLKWGKIIARKHESSSNRIMTYELEPIGVFNHYGDYKSVEQPLRDLLFEYMQENELYIKSKKREELLNKIL